MERHEDVAHGEGGDADGDSLGNARRDDRRE